jgi:hypothetical protein
MASTRLLAIRPQPMSAERTLRSLNGGRTEGMRWTFETQVQMGRPREGSEQRITPLDLAQSASVVEIAFCGLPRPPPAASAVRAGPTVGEERPTRLIWSVIEV